MADNLIYEPGYKLSVVCSNPTTPASGDPVRYGNLTGLALTDESGGGNASGYTTVDFGPYVADLSVKAVDDNGNSAVAVGDALWYVDADTPKLSKKTAGYFFGFALEAIGSGSTDTINVLHCPAPGTGTLAASSIGATQLASSAVTTAKLASAAVETAKIADVNVTEAKIEVGAASAGLSGLIAKFVAAANVIGGIPVVHWVHVTAGVNGNTDVVLTHKTKVVLVIAHPTTSVASATLQVQNGTTNAITDAMATPTANAVVLCASINPTYEDIAAGGTLRITGAGGATMPAADVFVLGFREA
jgi:hypothetical protein